MLIQNANMVIKILTINLLSLRQRMCQTSLISSNMAFVTTSLIWNLLSEKKDPSKK